MGICHEPVDTGACETGDLEDVPGKILLPAGVAASWPVGLEPATAHATGQGAGRGCHQEVGTQQVAPCKKNALNLNAWLVFVDESGFSQRPPVRSTWAPRGQTPIIHEPFNWKRLSGIAAIFTTPDAGRIRWFLALHQGGICARHVVRFLRALRRHRRKKVILIWDRLPAHRSRVVRELLRRYRSWLSIEWLPPYAPELNPVEPFWDHLDDTVLANTPADNLGRLRRRLHAGLRRLRHRPTTSRGFLRYTALF